MNNPFFPHNLSYCDHYDGCVEPNPEHRRTRATHWYYVIPRPNNVLHAGECISSKCEKHAHDVKMHTTVLESYSGWRITEVSYDEALVVEVHIG
jgi:hypothetical protein